MAGETFGRIKGVTRELRWRIIAALLGAALLPLLLAGIGSRIVFGNLLEKKSLELMWTIVESHAQAIESHLSERLHFLQLAAGSHNLENLAKPDYLERLLNNLNRSSDKGFVDLGIIDSEGNHLAYIGPYDLAGRNYHQAEWFKEVSVSGEYISDVFLGYRQVPHCIIAVKVFEGNTAWILRATISSDQFDAQVRTGLLGEGSEAFIVNRDGFYQTSPMQGSLLERSLLQDIEYHPGVRDRRVEINGVTKLQVTTWINDNRWMLVIQKDLLSVQAPVNEAITRGAYVVFFAFIILVLTTFIATWHLTSQISKATAGKEEMSKAFMRSAKLASIGELTTGLAHEINNPLAIISAEQTNISDVLQDLQSNDSIRLQALESIKRCQTQVRRCANITKKLLQFGRSKESHLEPTDIAQRLDDVKTLMQRQARLRNIDIKLNIEDDLPRAMVDPVELEQVLVNLINNSFDAMPGGGDIIIEAQRQGGKFTLAISDNGSGISPENHERVFEPFYTTKPVGKGTGLGLSVCYGIVHSWGGAIEARSKLGAGTTILITIPLRAEDLRVD